MDERNNKPVPQLIEVEPMQDGYRWVAITAMLLAIGIILHTVSPNVGGVTPNWTIAMYSIVINLTRPQAVAGYRYRFYCRPDAGSVLQIGFPAGQRCQ